MTGEATFFGVSLSPSPVPLGRTPLPEGPWDLWAPRTCRAVPPRSPWLRLGVGTHKKSGSTSTHYSGHQDPRLALDSGRPHRHSDLTVYKALPPLQPPLSPRGLPSPLPGSLFFSLWIFIPFGSCHPVPPPIPRPLPRSLSPLLWVCGPFSLPACPPFSVDLPHLPITGHGPSLRVCDVLLATSLKTKVLLSWGRGWAPGGSESAASPRWEGPRCEGGDLAVPKHPERKLSLGQYFLLLQ